MRIRNIRRGVNFKVATAVCRYLERSEHVTLSADPDEIVALQRLQAANKAWTSAEIEFGTPTHEEFSEITAPGFKKKRWI